MDLWLSKLDQPLKKELKFKTTEGVEGLVRVFKPLSHVRMSWKKWDWNKTFTLQVRLIGNEVRLLSASTGRI